jgi:2-polyprenyl-3-methyl-5-hydroxy-6-metoxy-1,4-benzoquinol methylase
VKKRKYIMMDLFSYYDGHDGLMVLDLGCGVGRNSIPMAEKIKEKNGQVICVDLLETALSKLMANSKQFGVQDYIKPVMSDIGEYVIFPNQFDIIVAVSSLEHVRSKETLNTVLTAIVLH